MSAGGMSTARMFVPTFRLGGPNSVLVVWCALILCAAFLFRALKSWTLQMPASAPEPLLAVLALTVIGIHIRWRDASSAFKYFVLGTTWTLALYNLVATITFPVELWPESLLFELLGRYAGVLSVLFAAGALLRPALALPACFLVLWKKHAFVAITGVQGTPTDWSALADSAVFVLIAIVVGLTAIKAGRYLSGRLSPSRIQDAGLDHQRPKRSREGRPMSVDPARSQIDRAGSPSDRDTSGYPQSSRSALDYASMAVLSAVAFHFGNYFYSGLDKALIGESWYQWLVANPTEVLILAAYVSGTLPLGFGEAFTTWVFEVSEFLRPVLNAAIFFGQIAAVVAIARIRWTILITAFYDLTHIGIFLLTGIFFWKWILLNLFIVMALITIRTVRIPVLAAVFLMVLVVVSTQFVFVARLAWFDTPAMNNIQIEAVTHDGEAVPVPSNHFLAYSVRFAQQRIAQPDAGDHFPTGTWGATVDEALFEEAVNCMAPSDGASTVGRYLARDRAEIVLRGTHAYLLDNMADDGMYRIDLYPHHIWSMPYLFPEYYELRLTDIAAYRIVIDSVCLRVEGQRVVYDPLIRGATDIPVATAALPGQ